MLKQTYRIIFLFFILLSLQSCSILAELLTPTSTEEIVKNLKLEYTDYKGLLGNTNISGTIENNNYSTVYDVTIKATIRRPNGSVSSQEIVFNSGIPSNSFIEFEDKIYTEKEDHVSLEIINARF